MKLQFKCERVEQREHDFSVFMRKKPYLEDEGTPIEVFPNGEITINFSGINKDFMPGNFYDVEIETKNESNEERKNFIRIKRS